MNTNHIDLNDPRLLDFVLGELEPSEAAELAEILHLPENQDALKEVKTLQKVVRISKAAFNNESVTPPDSLTPEQRQTILKQANLQSTSRKMHPAIWSLRLLAAAALLLLCAAGFLHYKSELFLDRLMVVTKQAPPSSTVENHMGRQQSEPATARTKTASVHTYDVAQEQDSLSVPTFEPSPLTEISGAEGRQPADDKPNQAPPKGISSGSTPSLMMLEPLTPSVRKLSSDDHIEEDFENVRPDPSIGIIVPPPLPPRQGGESYSRLEEQPFNRTVEAPLSTFSLHPDTAAYTNIRRFLKQGQRPPENAVRIEEMINYFSYAYPQPVGEQPFSVNIEVADCPWAEGHLLAKIGLQGRELHRQERPPANLVFLIDTSGSMEAPNRLPLVKESMKALFKALKPSDLIGIVTYAGDSRVALKSTPVSKRNRILKVIETLTAGGSTHGSAGIEKAYQLAQDNFNQAGINRVILATDGDFNVGVTSRAGLLSLIENKRDSGIFLTVLGYGMGNLKDANLETLATKGNGNYAYIDSYSEARRVLVEQLTGTLMTIAKDTKIQVEFNPAQVRSYRLIGFENRHLAHSDFNDDTKDAGEIGAGHSVTALYQLVPVGMPVEAGVDDLRYQEQTSTVEQEPMDNGELMFVKLRYKLPDSDTSTLLEIPVPSRSASLSESTDDFRFVAAVAAFGLLLRNSHYKGASTFEMARELANSSLGNDPRRTELLDLIVTAKTLFHP